MINNAHLIRPLLKFESPNDFYFLQLLKRRKDNPDLERDMNVLGDYYIYSLEQFDNLMPKIIKICNDENARAYFRLNRRDAKKVGLQMLKRITDLIISENYRPIKNSYASIAGEFHSDPDKTWLIDIDWIDYENFPGAIEKIKEIISNLQIEAKREPLMIEIPTKNGFHIITRPFNISKLNQLLIMGKLPQMDSHKDNPTILYIA
jgi:hypothetical protein